MKRFLLILIFLACFGSAFGQTPGTSQYPTSLDTNTTLLTAVNGCSTTLNGAVDNSQTTFTVVSTTCFPSSGIFAIESEVVIYTGKTATTFTGLTRGAFGSAAASHNNGISCRLSILAQYHNVLRDAVIAAQTKLGGGAATAANNQVLRGTGSGTTDFGQVTTNYLAGNTVTFAKIQQIATARLLGRSTSGTGDIEEISIGSGLSLAGGTLSATGGGGGGAWSDLTDPAADLSLAMATRRTTFTWGSDYGSNPAFDLQGTNTSATGPLLRLRTGVSTNMPPLLVEARTGQSVKADHLRNVMIGKDAPGNTDTDGYLYLGVIGSNLGPSGTPTSITGFAPLVIESDGINDERTLHLYAGGKWNDIGGVVKRYDTGSGSGNQTLDFNSATSANVTRVFTLTDNVTFTAWNNPPKAGSLVTVVLVQDATGSRTVTWPSSVKWPGGTAPTLTTTGTKRDVFVFNYDGSNYYNVAQALNQ